MSFPLKRKKWIFKLIVISLSLVLSLTLGEITLRLLVFSSSENLSVFRKPGYYSNYFSDNYWLLYHRIDNSYKAPVQPHPLLGWISDFARKTYMHNQIGQLGNRRPVLLYGDSFAHCVDATCFQEILNEDSLFAKQNFLLNYGVGGYGVDQIDLLMRNSAHHFARPLIVFSLMTSDLDRSLLKVRIGQKPWYDPMADTLVLKGVPVDSSADHFFENHPPKIASYFLNLLNYSPLNFLPEKIRDSIQGENERQKQVISLNEKILNETLKYLQAKEMDFVFLIFHFVKPGDAIFDPREENNYRDNFLREFLTKNQVPYIWSKDLIREDTDEMAFDLTRYIAPDNGHPTSYFNTLIAAQIKKYAIEIFPAGATDSLFKVSLAEGKTDTTHFYQSRLKEAKNRILSDPTWSGNIRKEAGTKNIPFRQLLFEHSKWLVNELDPPQR